MQNAYDTDGRGFAWFRRCVDKERSSAGLVFNPFARSFWASAHDVYDELRESSPVHFSELLDCWMLTGHRDVVEALLAHRVLRSNPFFSSQQLLDPFALLNRENPSLFMNDPPEHTRLRRIASGAFGVGAIRRVLPELERCIDKIVRGLGKRGDRVDLVSKFAQVVPLRALALITGLDIDRPNEVSQWIASVAAGMEPLATMRSANEAREAYVALQSYLEQKRAARFPPGTLCWTIQRAVHSGGLTQAEAQQLLFFVVLSGTKTVSDLLVSGAHCLAQAPIGSVNRSRVDDQAVEQMLLRFSPVQMVARTAAADLKVSGKSIRAGQRVLLVLASANCEVAKPPAGAAASGERSPRGVAFGRGIHACLGAHFARVQVRHALAQLMRTFPDVQVTDAAPARRGIAFKAWSKMNVVL